MNPGQIEHMTNIQIRDTLIHVIPDPEVPLQGHVHGCVGAVVPCELAAQPVFII